MDSKVIRKIASTSLSLAKRRAKRDNLEFDLDLDFLVSIYPEQGLCPILGYEMKPGSNSNCKSGPNKFSPTLDKVNPRKGYTKDNVEWVCHLANTMMNNAEGKDLIRFADWINRKYVKKEDASKQMRLF